MRERIAPLKREKCLQKELKAQPKWTAKERNLDRSLESDSQRSLRLETQRSERAYIRETIRIAIQVKLIVV